MRLVDYPGSPRTLALARCTVGGLMLWIMAAQDLPGAAEIPHVWFDQIGPVALLPREWALTMLDIRFLSILRWTGIALAIAFAGGVSPAPLIGTLLALTATLAQCLGPKAFTGGFATHHENAAILTTLLLAACYPRPSACPHAANRTARGVMLMCALVIGIMYMEVGCHRLLRGGAAMFLGDTIVAWQVSHSLQYSETGFRLGLLAANHPVLAVASKAGFLLATIAELVAPLCVLMGTRRRIAWIGALIAMHVGSALMMNVHFWENLVLLLVFCSGLTQWGASAGSSRRAGITPATMSS
ncbi:MAG: hypothetical protein FGM37_02910 [Phycisphaerales bacterium]|nr:hypothetical protein [Phycisphaerales bacterium]